MKKNKTIFVFFVMILLGHDYASAMNAVVLPSEVAPGDAFVIRVSGPDINIQPGASLNGGRFHFNACGNGCFAAIGVTGLDTKPGVYSIEVSHGSDIKNLPLTVIRPAFPTIRLMLPKDKVFLSPKDLVRARSEDERLAELWKAETDKLWDGNFILPVDNEVLTAFGAKRIINGKMVSVHRGVDIKGKEGVEIRASNKGRVVLEDELFFGGNTLILDHGQGIYTIYMHLSRFNVGKGDIVLKGDVIGFVGSSGRASGPHLHFGVKVLNTNTNPFSMIRLNL